MEHTINVKLTKMQLQQAKAVKEPQDGAMCRWIQRVFMEHIESRQRGKIDAGKLIETGAIEYFTEERGK